jgi:hypothetical protein
VVGTHLSFFMMIMSLRTVSTFFRIRSACLSVGMGFAPPVVS